MADKREMINNAAADIHKMPTIRTPNARGGMHMAGPETKPDMNGAFNSKPGEINIKSLGRSPKGA